MSIVHSKAAKKRWSVISKKDRSKIMSLRATQKNAKMTQKEIDDHIRKMNIIRLFKQKQKNVSYSIAEKISKSDT